MKRLKKCLISLVLAISLIFALSNYSQVAAKASSYFSISAVGLDYKRGVYGIYGAGKNGYALICIENIKGNTLYYKKYKFYYNNKVGIIGKKYGKLKTAKLTRSTKYFLGSTKRYLKLIQKEIEKGNYISGIHNKKFKNVKWLQKVNKNMFLKKQTGAWTYVRVKQGKVQKIVSRLQVGS